MISRRKMVTATLATLTIGMLPATSRGKPGPKEISVYKTATCGCCQAWVDHLQQHGFTVTARNVTAGRLSQIKSRLGIHPKLASCHTAKIGNYVIEGHVPATDITRLLQEKPAARGLTVPGMPMGSPGMDFGDERENYASLLIDEQGQIQVFQTHN